MNATAPKRKRTRTREKNSISFSQRLGAPAAFLVILLTNTVLLLLAAAVPLHAQTTLTVTSLDDSGTGTLRDAITEANGATEEYIIEFETSLNGSILLTTSLPAITSAGGLTINGDHRITVSGNNPVRPFNVNAGASLGLENLTVSNGFGFSGGGIFNDGTVTLTNSTLSGNTANDTGGGIFNNGTLTLINSTLSGNTAGFDGGIGIGIGGGIFNTDGGTVILTNSTLNGNTARPGAGGIYNDAGTVTLTNSTLSGNSASGTSSGGGGIYNFGGALILINSTLSGNSASYGGGIYNIGSGTLTLTNSLIANSPSGGDCFNLSSLNDNGHNLVEDGSCITVDSNGNLSGDPLFTDPENGDYTLSAASPAINAGSNQAYEIAGGDLENDLDLAGNPRVFDGTIDIGAYEFQVEPISPDANNILYVNQNVSGSNQSGDSWENALPELADALKWAREQHDTGNGWDGVNDSLQIWVAKGTYKPLYNAEDGNYKINGDRDNAFVLVKNVQLYGGFDPDNGIDDLTDSRIVPSPSGGAGGGSMLSGDFNDNDMITGSGATFSITGNDENAHHVLISANDVGNALVDGFTISGGLANGNTDNFTVNGQNINRQQGGGIHKHNSSLSLTNMEIFGNVAFNGGGMYNSGTGTFYLTNVDISRNLAIDGGGIYNSGTINLANVAISGNRATYGGGIFNEDILELTNVEISENSANNGGGIYNFSTLKLTNVEVSGNTAVYGGGIYNDSGTIYPTNVTLANNTAGTNGNGIYNDGSVNIANSIVWNAIINDSGGSYTAQNSVIIGNNDTTNGNIDASSLTAIDIFTDATNGDYSLVLSSPAINAGDNTAYTTAGGDLQDDLDLAGNPRLDAIIIDIGAYEFQGAPVSVITLTLAEGWRMFSSPVDGLTYDDMLGDLWTQGMDGADYEGDANTFPNVYTWPNDEPGTDQSSWEPVGDLTDPIPAGTGFLMYVFEDDNYGDNTGWSDKTITLSGATHTGDIKPEMNSTPAGWTLVGNPYGQPVSFSEVVNNTGTTGLTDAAYVYDPNLDLSPNDPGPVNGNGGAWRSIAGLYGDIPSGNIAPGQGFFVQTASSPAGTPALTFSESDRTGGGEFYGKESELRDYVRLEVQGESLYNSAWIRFSEDGSLDRTDGEALELQPLSANYALLGARKSDGVLMDIAHYPLNEQNLEIPLALEATQSGKFTIRATNLDLPAGMQLYLHDRQSGQSMSIGDETFEYSFSVTVNEPKTKTLTPKEILATGAVGPSKATTSGTDRFLITTSPGSPVSELPNEVALGQNYPNPFNPATVIRYQLPVSSEVRLEVYDMLGRNVATLVDGQVAAGTHQVSFDAGNLSSGVYLYQLTANGTGGANQIFTKKLTLIK